MKIRREMELIKCKVGLSTIIERSLLYVDSIIVFLQVTTENEIVDDRIKTTLISMTVI